MKGKFFPKHLVRASRVLICIHDTPALVVVVMKIRLVGDVASLAEGHHMITMSDFNVSACDNFNGHEDCFFGTALIT